MSSRDRFKMGTWNAICDVCGFQRKADEMKLTWDGKRVCKEDWEPRHPQEFVRGESGSPALPWTRPEPPDRFLNPGDVTPGNL